jgi:ketosteroid isomerase-like protein
MRFYVIQRREGDVFFQQTHMNPEANIALVQKAYADFVAGDIPSIIAALSDEVEWINPGKGVPTGGIRHGKAEVSQFFDEVAKTNSPTLRR